MENSPLCPDCPVQPFCLRAAAAGQYQRGGKSDTLWREAKPVTMDVLDLRVDKIISSDTAFIHDTLTCTILLANCSSVVLRDVVVVETLDAGLELLEPIGAGLTLLEHVDAELAMPETTRQAATQAAQQATRKIDTMQPGQTLEFLYQARVRPEARGTLNTTTTVSYAAHQPHTLTAQAAINVLAVNLAVKLLLQNPAVQVREETQVTLQVQNTGNIKLEDVTVTCQLPCGLSYIHGTTRVGEGLAAETPDKGLEANPGAGEQTFAEPVPQTASADTNSRSPSTGADPGEGIHIGPLRPNETALVWFAVEA